MYLARIHRYNDLLRLNNNKSINILNFLMLSSSNLTPTNQRVNKLIYNTRRYMIITYWRNARIYKFDRNQNKMQRINDK